MDIKVRDSNGADLAEGDSVTLIKDLKLKGSSTVLKRGDQRHSPHRQRRRDRRPHRRGQGPGAAHGVLEEGVRETSQCALLTSPAIDRLLLSM
jgi:hypothetical protein